jgi:hypothetical protein
MAYTVMKTTGDFNLYGQGAGRHPTIISPDGTVFLPVVPFLHARVKYTDRAHGSIMDDSYILCGWLNYLYKLKVDWTRPSDNLIQRYASFQRRKKIKKARIQTCADLIFNFYWAAQFSFGLIEGIVQDPAITSDQTQYPVTATFSKNGKPRGRFALTTIPKGRRRPTPIPEQTEQILDFLLDHKNIERGHCRWLCASLMGQAGLRVEGVANLTLPIIADGLKADGIHRDGKAYNLSEVSKCPATQREIIVKIEALLKRGRKKIYVDPIEKSKERKAGIPLTLLENILHYIWSMRYLLVCEKNAEQALFISLKGGKALKKKSIGNLVSGAFKALEIPGSAHRLRAAFVENVVRGCYLRQRAAHGQGWDRDSVLLEAAEALGHSDTSSLVYYLNRILRELNMVDGEPILVTALEELETLRSLVDAVNSGNSKVIGQLREIEQQLLFAA